MNGAPRVEGGEEAVMLCALYCGVAVVGAASCSGVSEDASVPAKRCIARPVATEVVEGTDGTEGNGAPNCGRRVS